MKNFKNELEALINKYSVENGSDTPDFILAAYLKQCIQNADNLINEREKWFGRKMKDDYITII